MRWMVDIRDSFQSFRRRYLEKLACLTILWQAFAEGEKSNG
jgi:hypothetical protein